MVLPKLAREFQAGRHGHLWFHIKSQRRVSIATHLISGNRAKQREEGGWKQCGNLVNMLRHFAFCFLFSLCIAARAVGIIGGAALRPMGKRWKQGGTCPSVPPPPPLRRHQSWQSAAKNPIEVVFHRKWRPFVRARVIGEEGGGKVGEEESTLSSTPA